MIVHIYHTSLHLTLCIHICIVLVAPCISLSPNSTVGIVQKLSRQGWMAGLPASSLQLSLAFRLPLSSSLQCIALSRSSTITNIINSIVISSNIMDRLCSLHLFHFPCASACAALDARPQAKQLLRLGITPTRRCARVRVAPR